jgi:lipoate-protein ligase A
VNECCVIVDPAAPGAWNMAVDEALLLDAADGGHPTLRLYAWSEPTLSIGYFQRVADRAGHAASRECALVRRQTGGGAILHDREITYSLVLPAGHPLGSQPTALYSSVHDAMIEVLTPLTDRESRQKLVRLVRISKTHHDDEPFLCFLRRAPDDVLLLERHEPMRRCERPADQSELQAGVKILGSAQRRYRGAEHLASAVSARETRCASTADVQLKAVELANNKYSTADWTNRR